MKTKIPTTSTPSGVPTPTPTATAKLELSEATSVVSVALSLCGLEAGVSGECEVDGGAVSSGRYQYVPHIRFATN